MKIAALKETNGEHRVALSPDSVKAFVRKGATVVIEEGAGTGSSMPDEAYVAAGASVEKKLKLAETDLVLSVPRPQAAALKGIRPGTVLIGMMDPYGDRGELEALAKTGATVFSMELMPRISRAQAMDVLSSQANLAGYKAVVDAASRFGRALPMMMTAAGTVAAAKVFVMGVGVAGLQAIATARRLGAIVSATDVRKATEEQVKSLGAKFVYADVADAATAAGYARELTAEEKAKQSELVAAHVKTQDIVITTALIPGRAAPILLTREMVESMKPGSVIIDLAAERGGNTPLTKPGEVVLHKGVSIVGTVNLAASLAGNASQLYARNIQNFLDPFLKDGALAFNFDDELVKGILIARDGALVHPLFAGAK